MGCIGFYYVCQLNKIDMKKILLLLIMGLIVISCSKSPEKVAQQLIKEWLNENMDDIKSYEPVKFGQLDTICPKWESIDSIKASAVEWEQIIADNKSMLIEYKSVLKPLDVEQIKENIRVGEFLYAEDLQLIQNYNDGYPLGFLGYKIEHSFRGANKVGGIVLQTATFIFDRDFTKVVKIENIKE